MKKQFLPLLAASALLLGISAWQPSLTSYAMTEQELREVLYQEYLEEQKHIETAVYTDLCGRTFDYYDLISFYGNQDVVCSVSPDDWRTLISSQDFYAYLDANVYQTDPAYQTVKAALDQYISEHLTDTYIDYQRLDDTQIIHTGPLSVLSSMMAGKYGYAYGYCLTVPNWLDSPSGSSGTTINFNARYDGYITAVSLYKTEEDYNTWYPVWYEQY